MLVLTIWRRLSIRFLSLGTPTSLCLEYSLLYVALLVMFAYDAVGSSYNLSRSAWLDPVILEERFMRDPSFMNMTVAARDELLATMSLRPYPWLRWLSLFTPIPVLLTWVICVWDTWRHARIIRSSAAYTDAVFLRDLVVQIIALPMVYVMLSYAAVIRMWQVASNKFGTTARKFTYEGREHYVFAVYEADYQIADLYEAWALYHFGTLVINVVKAKFGLISSHRVFGAGARVKLNTGGLGIESEVDVEKQRREFEDALLESVQRLTMQGILPFVFCCFAQSIYGLVLPLAQAYISALPPDVWESMRHGELRAHDFFLGMGAVASTAAIANIVRVEHIFHNQLREFKPFWKFWGTKILVSIAFLQMIVFKLPVPLFKHMSQVHTNLLYSSLLCYECFGVSLLHMYAWQATESWYGDGGRSIRSNATADDEDESKPFTKVAATPSSSRHQLDADFPEQPTPIGRRGADLAGGLGDEDLGELRATKG